MLESNNWTDFSFDFLVNICCREMHAKIMFDCNLTQVRMCGTALIIFLFLDIELTLQEQGLTWTNYHPLADHQHWLETVARQYSNIVQTEKIGESVESRPLKVLKICHQNKCGKNQVFWIDGAIHPREWISPVVVTYFVKVPQ